MCLITNLCNMKTLIQVLFLGAAFICAVEANGDPKRGHHLYNNVPKTIVSTLNQFFRGNFERFYFSLDPKHKQWLEGIHLDYCYWKNDPVVNELRDKMKIATKPTNLPGGDANSIEYGNAAKDFLQTVNGYLHQCALGGCPPQTNNIVEVVFRLRASYIDDEVDVILVKKLSGKERDDYNTVKSTLARDMKDLAKRVLAWGKEVRDLTQVTSKKIEDFVIKDQAGNIC